MLVPQIRRWRQRLTPSYPSVRSEEAVATTTVTRSDVALTGCVYDRPVYLAMDPAEWTLDQLQRTILDVHTSPSS